MFLLFYFTVNLSIIFGEFMHTYKQKIKNISHSMKTLTTGCADTSWRRVNLISEQASVFVIIDVLCGMTNGGLRNPLSDKNTTTTSRISNN